MRNRLSYVAVWTALALAQAYSTSAIAGDPTSSATVLAPGTQSDDAKVFLSTVLATTEDFWGTAFQADGLKYEEPKLVLYSAMIGTACGAVSGSSYCANDHKIYIDPEFPDLRKVGATGEFSEAVTVALEVAYHVQNITGTKGRSTAAGKQDADAARTELQADCFVGLWSRYVQDKGLLKDGELREARDLLRRLGDDQATGPASEQRIRWFDKGLTGKGIADCNTIAGQP